MADWPYNTAQWQRVRAMVLRDQPLCVMCQEIGRLTPSAVVDHIKPVCDHPDLAFDLGNLQGLCKLCHDSAKQRYEKSGVMVGSKVDGMPVDRGHWWYDDK